MSDIFANQMAIRSETDYRTERARRTWVSSRKGSRRTRRWQGPLRGADEMR